MTKKSKASTEVGVSTQKNAKIIFCFIGGHAETSTHWLFKVSGTLFYEFAYSCLQALETIK